MLEMHETARVEHQPLIAPSELHDAFPATDAVTRTVRTTRRAVADIVHGRDAKRLLVVVGPCSIHDPDAALDYADRLARVSASTAESLVIVMRTYFEKPRTTLGWKGLIADPDLDGSCDVGAGLARSRALLLAINGLGVACGSELLDPLTPAFLADLLSWAGIGARTAESQTHRQLASGMPMPVGFKNGTDGSLETAVNAVIAAGGAHRYPGIDLSGRSALVQTHGNPDGHIVLRGGRGGPNFGPDSVDRAIDLLASRRPDRSRASARPVMIDCSHDNSGQDHTRQSLACREVLKQVCRGNGSIMGLLIESNLAPGRQDWNPGLDLRPGVSITDACIGWGETADLLYEIAEAAKIGL